MSSHLPPEPALSSDAATPSASSPTPAVASSEAVLEAGADDDDLLKHLPRGLAHYELHRTFTPEPANPSLWRHAIVYRPGGIPELSSEYPVAHRPIDPEQFFGVPGPIEIEIGTGKGGFLVEYGERHPDRPLLGVEWTLGMARYAADRVRRRPHLRHAKVVWAEAFYLLRDHIPSSCCRAFHVYFLDPWPKERTHKRRLIQPELLEQLRRVAIPGASLHWGTDHAEYNDWALERFHAAGFRLIDPAAAPTEGIRTNFEKKYIREGRPIHRSVWEIRPAQ